jgi:hypothetical protein
VIMFKQKYKIILRFREVRNENRIKMHF